MFGLRYAQSVRCTGREAVTLEAPLTDQRAALPQRACPDRRGAKGGCSWPVSRPRRAITPPQTMLCAAGSGEYPRARRAEGCDGGQAAVRVLRASTRAGPALL